MFNNLTDREQNIFFMKMKQIPENNICADCKSKGASWVSLGYGVFVCINCSGVHRSFGMHITRVRSTKLDSWTRGDAKIMQTIGNKLANMYWEHHIIFHHKEHIFLEDNRAEYIKNKYLHSYYIKKDA